MNEMTVEEFCGLHRACADGRDWAVKNCTSMEDAWGKLKPEWVIWVATRRGVLTGRELRLFAVWSARQIQHLMRDPRSLKALDVAERYANGLASDEELKVAREDAEIAADAARDGKWSDEWVTARAVTRAADWAAARDVACAAKLAAEWTAAWAARRAARAAAETSQVEWLRANTKPNFGRSK